METEVEYEMVRVKSREGRLRRHAIGTEGIHFSPDEDYNDEKENSAPCLRDKTKTRLERLGILYGDGEISSPIHKTEDRWVAADENDTPPSALNDKYSEERSRRLAALASTINSWEDDVRHISPRKEEVERIDRFGNKVGSKAVKHETVQPQTGLRVQNAPQSPSPKKKVAWDRKILNSLEMQGFKRCESEEHLVYDYVSPNSKKCTSPRKTPAKKVAQKNDAEVLANRTREFVSKIARELEPQVQREPQPLCSITQNPPPKKLIQERRISPVRHTSPVKQPPVRQPSPVKPPTPVRQPSPVKQPTPVRQPSPVRNYSPVRRPSPQKSAVMEIAAQFETSRSPTKPAKNVKDPALMSVAEKRAVFERNHGFVPIPQAPIATVPGAFPIPKSTASSTYQRDRSPIKTFQRDVSPVKTLHRDISPTRTFHRDVSPTKTFQRERSPPPPKKVVIRDRSPPVKKVFQPISSAPSEEGPIRHNVNQAVIDRFKEIEALRHRWDRNKALASQNQENEDEEDTESPPPQRQNSGVPPPPPPMPSTHEFGRLSPVEPRSPRRDISPSKIKMGTKSPARKDSPKRELPRVLSVREKSAKREFQYPLVKKIKVSPTKPGRLYPSISDIETESEVPESDLDPIEEEGSDENEEEERQQESSFSCSTELETSNVSVESFGQIIVRKASQNALKRPSRSLEESSEMPSSSSDSESRILREMDDLLDEALGEPSPKRSRDSEHYEAKLSITPISETCSSTSFEYSSDKFSQPSEAEVKEKTPLIHTVSVYRKQQQMSTTPMRREVHHNEDYGDYRNQPEPEDTISEEELVLEKIAELQMEVKKQLETISQASKALSLCLTTPGFEGSSAEIEAQKLLLVSNARWNALNQEIERLKIERKLKPGLDGGNLERGDISLSGISLPIKAFQSTDASMSVICLVRSGATVLHTEVLPVDRKTIRGGKLSFQKVVTLKGLYSDFMATIEVYGYSKKCVDPSEKDFKNRTTPKKDKGKTPKKNKDKGFFPVESPAGPNAVRSSAFQVWGFAVFSLREVCRKSFTLNKVPYTCPLDGTLEVTMSSSMDSQIEHSGFLTVYEDVSGFGAWKRRWAVLHGSSLAFWAYPDQWKEGKVALDTIDLTSITTTEACLAPREVCARPHTILLESHIKDHTLPESLVVRRQGEVTVIMHLLSADTKEERLMWCEQFNKVLHLLRAWKVSKNT